MDGRPQRLPFNPAIVNEEVQRCWCGHSTGRGLFTRCGDRYRLDRLWHRCSRAVVDDRSTITIIITVRERERKINITVWNKGSGREAK